MSSTDPRRLRVDYLHYPRSFRARHYRWDLDRGFRLEVLGAGRFWFSLLDPGGVDRAIAPEGQGLEQDFLLQVARQSSGAWPGWDRDRLGPHTICVILSDSGRACRVPRDWPNLVLWVRQPMLAGTVWTGNDFFTPEQTLYQWGRVGRRVQRRSRWRALIPW
ncbi:hypothetical protein ABS71_12375 [bacterium SCN 62-11]|nr:hypothetical protein [Candidatus Eremiobacteraeota bacterium]ODT65200.1 MAG: hypothetical protein ABS71_12375 [bacterium SCN 62-11]